MPPREALHFHLLQVCFGITPSQVQPVVAADPVAAQVDKLVADAQSKPKPKVARTIKEGDVKYLRSALFPKVIYAIYNNTCAVCGLGVRIGDSRVLNASHIRDFALFGDNHPSNGLALCHNHHWGFDRGGFSITDDYVSAGSSLYPPASPKCHPDPAALAWHRDKKFISGCQSSASLSEPEANLQERPATFTQRIKLACYTAS